MKKFKIRALALSLVVGMTQLTVSAEMTTFPDIEGHWAKSHIQDMVEAGMFKGYEDGTFRPENQLTTSEALALCARSMNLDEDVATVIEEDYQDILKGIMGANQWWFWQEYAICLEAGIIDYDSLKYLYDSGDLGEPIEKQVLSVYLVRAMQLGPMAEKLTYYSMNFDDVKDIDAELQPYVYLLNNYGIVQGDENGNFSPEHAVDRAVMATMLSRAISFMDEQGVVVDLPNYDDYAFQQGEIAEVSREEGLIILTLTRDLVHENDENYLPKLTISLPENVLIYEDNMESSTAALREGNYARVVYNDYGRPVSVRVSDPLDVISGVVRGVEGQHLSLLVDGMLQTVSMNRFTKVRISNNITGDYTLIDPQAGYTSAVCSLDDQGHVVSVALTGGNYRVDGVLTSVELGNSANEIILTINDFSGIPHTYTMNSNTPVTINGVLGTLTSLYNGRHIEVRISNLDGSIVSVEVDSINRYVQGYVSTTYYSEEDGGYILEVEDPTTGSIALCLLSNDCIFRYKGDSVVLADIPEGEYVTVCIDKWYAVQVDASSGTKVIDGIITKYTYGSGSDVTKILLEVTLESGETAEYKLDMIDPPEIFRNEVESTLDKLRVGEGVSVTSVLGDVTKIVTKQQESDFEAIIESILKTTTGYTLSLLLDSGEVVSYTVASGLYVTQEGREVDLSTLDAGYRVGLVLNRDEIIAIEIHQTIASNYRLEATVITVSHENIFDQNLLVKAVDANGAERAITVKLDDSTPILSASTGESLPISTLKEGDLVEITGYYQDAIFRGTIVIKISN